VSRKVRIVIAILLLAWAYWMIGPDGGTHRTPVRITQP